MRQFPAKPSAIALAVITACCCPEHSFRSLTQVSADDATNGASDGDPYRSCGVNCFVIICRMRAIDEPLASANALLRPRKNGDCSVADLECAARAVGLDVISAKLNRPDLYRVPFPAIVHLRSHALQSSSNHYVVLTGMFRKGIVTIDPPNEPTYHPYEEFFDDWTGVVVAFPENSQRRRAFVASLQVGSWWRTWALVLVSASAPAGVAWALKTLLDMRKRTSRVGPIRSVGATTDLREP